MVAGLPLALQYDGPPVRRQPVTDRRTGDACAHDQKVCIDPGHDCSILTVSGANMGEAPCDVAIPVQFRSFVRRHLRAMLRAWEYYSSRTPDRTGEGASTCSRPGIMCSGKC